MTLGASLGLFTVTMLWDVMATSKKQQPNGRINCTTVHCTLLGGLRRHTRTRTLLAANRKGLRGGQQRGNNGGGLGDVVLGSRAQLPLGDVPATGTPQAAVGLAAPDRDVVMWRFPAIECTGF
eukprot:1194998-Prorocentrum_minimum.AAC.2